MAASTDVMDYGSAEEALKRKRLMADMLMKSSLNPEIGGQMVSGHYIDHSVGNGIKSIAQAMAGQFMGADADKASTALGNEKQAALLSGMEGYMNTRNGTPAQDIPYQEGQIAEMMHNDTPLPVQQQTPAVAADPRGAAIKAIASQFPQLQGLGMADLAAMNKPKDPEGYGTSAQEFLRPDGTMGLMQLGNQGGKPRVLEGVNGVPKKALVENNINTAENKGANKLTEAMSTETVKELSEGKVLAKKATDSLAQLYDIKPLLKDAQTGFGAQPAVILRKIWQKLGGDADGAITATENLKSAIAQKVLDNAKALGSGSAFSNTDRTFLEEVVQGKVDLDPQTLLHSINAGIAGGHNTILRHNQAVEGSKSFPGMTDEYMNYFRAAQPHMQLSADEFDFDEKTGIAAAKVMMPRKNVPGGSSAAPAKKPVLKWEDM